MNTKYVVLDNKLLPAKVADLLLEEALGNDYKSVMTVFSSNEQTWEIYLEILLQEAKKNNINHNYDLKFINEMISKMVKNNSPDNTEITVKIFQGKKDILYAYFSP